MSIKTLFGIAAAIGVGSLAAALPATAQSAAPQAQAAADCREFQQTITVGGETQEAFGTTCQQADGRWKVMGVPQPAPQATPQAAPPSPAPYAPAQVAAVPAYPVYSYPYYAYPYPYYSYPAYAYAGPAVYGRVGFRGRWH